MIRFQNRRGLTLLELLVVLTILAALATLVVPMIGQFGSQSQAGSTWESMLRLQDLIVNHYMADMHDASGNGELPRPGYAGLNGTGVNGSTTTARSNHPQLRYLFINPGPLDATTDTSAETPFPSANITLLSPRRWNGPYVTHQGARYPGARDPTAAAAAGFGAEFGVADVDGVDQTTGATAVTTYGDPTVLDAWNNPIVIQVPNTSGGASPSATDLMYARLVSAGPNGKLETPETEQMPPTSDRGDDVVMFLFVPDQYGATSGPKLH
jgi:prepilin-type N-terminal cleavage/methylation domain-containing protein